MACRGWSPVVTMDATASATTQATRPANDQRSRRENSLPKGRTLRPAGSGGPEYDTVSRTMVPAPGGGGHRAFVGQEPRRVLTAALRTVRAGRVVGGGREQGQRAQARVGDLPGSWRLPFHGPQHQPVGLYDLAGPGDRGRRQRGRGGVRVGEHGRGGIEECGPGWTALPSAVSSAVSSGIRSGALSDVRHTRHGQGGGLVEEGLDVLAETAVVEPDDQAQTGVEAARHQRGADVRLVVVMDERQRGGMLDTGFGEHGLGQDGGFQHPGGARLLGGGGPIRRGGSPGRRGSTGQGDGGPAGRALTGAPASAGSTATAVAAAADTAVGRRTGHRRRHPVEQRRGTGPSDDRRPYGALGGRYDQRHPFAVDTTQLGRQPVREGIVPAHHHVRTAIVRPALIRKARHNSTECLTGTDGCTGACRKGVEAGVPRDTGRPNRPTALPEGW